MITSTTSGHININNDLTLVVNGIYDPATRIYSSDTEDGIIDYFTDDVVSQSDYYSFGIMLPGRNSSEEEYRYGFQGQEMDDVIKGEGNSVNYTFRKHYPRVGRFFAVDPLRPKYPHYTPYSFSGNKVIHCMEIEGLEDLALSGTIVNDYGPTLGFPGEAETDYADIIFDNSTKNLGIFNDGGIAKPFAIIPLTIIVDIHMWGKLNLSQNTD